jgi:hypothetical protein
MEFRYGQPETEIEVLEEKARHYYTYYILPKEKKVPSLLDSISTARENESPGYGGLETSLGADSLLQERVKQDKLAVDLLVRQIEEREILKAHHLTTIDEEMSYAKEQIFWEFLKILFAKIEDEQREGRPRFAIRNVDERNSAYSDQIVHSFQSKLSTCSEANRPLYPRVKSVRI